jgi:hypothetical protein
LEFNFSHLTFKTLLHFLDKNFPIYIASDVSYLGFKNVTFQIINREKRIIVLNFRSIKKHETYYVVTKLKLTKLCFAIGFYHDLILGRPFYAIIDHRSITSFVTLCKKHRIINSFYDILAFHFPNILVYMFQTCSLDR